MDKVWEVKDSSEYRKKQKRGITPRETMAGPEKNPGRAYTLSLLFWGAGQNYNRETGKSLVFNIIMLAVLVGTILSFIFGRSFVRFLISRGASASLVFLTAEILFFCLLVFWRYNAGNAYHSAARSRRTPFRGIESRTIPLLCSLLVPGWGQFLNGQPLKGSFYSAFSVLALLSFAVIPSTLLAWPLLEPSDARLVIETVFAVTFLYAPLIPFVWIFGSFDALRVSMDDLKKEPLWERLKSANNRRRTQGWVHGVFPQARSTILLGLLFASLLTLGAGIFPRLYYLDGLKSARTWMEKQGMSVVPDLIARIVEKVDPGGEGISTSP